MALGLGEPSKLTKYKRKISTAQQTKDSRKMADDELIFNLEEEHVSDLSQTQSLTFPVSSGHQFSQTGSLKLKNKSPIRQAGRFNSVRLSRHVTTKFYLFCNVLIWNAILLCFAYLLLFDFCLAFFSASWLAFVIIVAGTRTVWHWYYTVVLCAWGQNRKILGQLEFLFHTGMYIGSGEWRHKWICAQLHNGGEPILVLTG